MFANPISDKGLTSRIHKDFSKFHSKKDPIRKWAKDMKIYFMKEDI